jgi:hypothetical protein
MDGTSVWLSGGFQAGRVYELRYTPADCPVVGTGLLAVRDFVSWLRRRHEDLTHAFAFGVSQSGRFLRELLYQGLNRDEDGRAVFDGVLVHVAGARRGEFNQRYGQPSAQHAPSPGHLPPFADAELLARQRERGAMPRVFSVNTSSEYWRSEASLCHADVELPEEARTYLFAGCQHGPGGVALTRSAPLSPWVRPANPLNTVDYTPLLRAALVNLERWVVDGVEPPPSAVPRAADGTAADRGEVLRRFAGREDVAVPREDRLPALRRLDFSTFPPAAGDPYECFVSAVDGDGNEVAGIRLPDLTVPLGAHTGWNPRHPDSGGEGQLIDMLGSTLPLPPPSIAERYGSREAYRERVREAAERLVEARQLLPEDVELVVTRAGLRWDVTTSEAG